MSASEEFYGEGHPATHDQSEKVETEFREVAPGQFGYLAVRDKVVVPRRAQLSEIAHGEGDERVMSYTVPERHREIDGTRDT